MNLVNQVIMLRLTVAVFLFTAALAFPSHVPVVRQGERIIGGAQAALGQFPYMAEIQLSGRHQCGGAIYNQRWIITAAHCVRGLSESDFVIFTGTTRLNAGGDRYNVQKIVEHRQYNPQSKQNDLALIKTSTDINFTENVQPLPLADSQIAEGADIVVSGWGFLSWPGTTPNDLMFIPLKIMNHNTCVLQMLWYNTVTDDQICSFTKYGQGVCGGDSGSPVVHDGKLVGIVSWGIPCGAGMPDIHVNVFNYVDWINANIE